MHGNGWPRGELLIPNRFQVGGSPRRTSKGDFSHVLSVTKSEDGNKRSRGLPNTPQCSSIEPRLLFVDTQEKERWGVARLKFDGGTSPTWETTCRVV